MRHFTLITQTRFLICSFQLKRPKLPVITFGSTFRDCSINHTDNGSVHFDRMQLMTATLPFLQCSMPRNVQHWSHAISHIMHVLCCSFTHNYAHWKPLW